MLSCEDAYLLAKMILEHEPETMLAVGPVPHEGQDKTFPGGYTMYAEKAPNARGVKRVLEMFSKVTLEPSLRMASYNIRVMRATSAVYRSPHPRPARPWTRWASRSSARATTPRPSCSPR